MNRIMHEKYNLCVFVCEYCKEKMMNRLEMRTHEIYCPSRPRLYKRIDKKLKVLIERYT